MKDCKIVLNNNVLTDLYGDISANTPNEIVNKLNSKLKGRVPFTIDSDILPREVFILNFAVKDSNLIAVTNHGNTPIESIVAQGHGNIPPVPGIDPAKDVVNEIDKVANSVDEVIEDNSDLLIEDANQFVKLPIRATTSYEISNGLAKDSLLFKGQRALYERVALAPSDYKIVMVEDREGILRNDPSVEPTGQVMLIVKATHVSDITNDNILEYAERFDNEVIPLYFEAPLSQSLNSSVFLGTREGDEVASRTNTTHQRRLKIVAEQYGMTEQEAQAMYERYFEQIQSDRRKVDKGTIVVYNITEVSNGFYQSNRNTLKELMAEDRKAFSPTQLLIDKKGSLNGIFDINGTSISLPLYGKNLTEEEIDFLVDNLSTYNKGSDPAITKAFDVLLGTTKRKNAFFPSTGGRLHFNNGNKTYTITKPDLFRKLLLEYPYRSRSKYLTQADTSITIPGYVSVRQYLLENFYPVYRPYATVSGGLESLPLNRYISYKQPTYIEALKKHTVNEQFLNKTRELTKNIQVEYVEEPIVIGTDEYDGVYLPDSSLIRLNSNAENLDNIELEERLHAIHHKFIADNADSVEVKNIRKVYEEVKQVAAANGISLNYGLSTFEEFLARGLTDIDTINLLTQIDKKSSRNSLEIIRKYLTKFLELFGIKDVPNSYYAELLDFTLTAAEAYGAPPVKEEGFDNLKNRKFEDIDPDDDFFGAKVENKKVIDVTDRATQIDIAHTLDTLLIRAMEADNSNFTVSDMVRNGITPNDVVGLLDKYVDRTTFNVETQPLVKFYKKHRKDAMRSWARYSNLFERKEITDEDVDLTIVKESEGQQNVWDRRGNEEMSINLAGNIVMRFIRSLPSGITNRFGVPKLADPKATYYDFLDAAEGELTLGNKLLAIQKLNTPESRAFIKRLPFKVEKDIQIDPTDINSVMFSTEIYRALHRPTLPFKVLVPTDRGYAFIQQTGVRRDKVLGRVQSNLLRKQQSFPEWFRNGENGVQLTPAWQKRLNTLLNNGQLVQALSHMGLFLTTEQQANAVIKSNLDSLNNLLPQIKESLEGVFKNEKVNPLEILLNAQTRYVAPLIEEYGKDQGISKTRMILGPDNQPISAETMPNTITQLKYLYNAAPYIGYENLGSEYGFLKTARFRNSLSYDYLFNSVDELEVIAYGGRQKRNGRGAHSADLLPGDWIGMNIMTFIKEGHMEIMRTESSGSSWSFKFKNSKYWVYDKEGFNNAIKKYLKGELETLLEPKAIDLKVDYTKDGFVYFDYLSEGLKDTLINNREATIDQVINDNWNEIVQEVNVKLQENIDDINNALVQYGVKNLDLDDMDLPTAVRLFAMNNLIYNIETSIMFDGGIEYYKQYHKRSKGKVSTGATSIANPKFWEGLNKSKTLRTIRGGTNNFTRQFNTAVIADQEMSRMTLTAEDATGRVGLEMTEAFAPIFNGAFQAFIDKKVLAGILPKHDSYDHPDYNDDYNYLAKEYAEYYNNMEVGDGAGYIDFDHYRALQMSVGNWPAEAEAHYQWELLFYKKNYQGKELTDEEMQFYRSKARNYSAASLKYSYFGPDLTYHTPVFDKFSLIPLLPSAIYDTNLVPLMHAMINKNLAYVKFASGTKAAKARSGNVMGPVDVFYDDGSSRSAEAIGNGLTQLGYQIDALFLKEQLKTNNKIKKDNIFGSQFRKLAFSDFMINGVPTEVLTEENAAKVKGLDKLQGIEKQLAWKKWWDSLTRTSQRELSPTYDRFLTYKKTISDLTKLETDNLMSELGLAFTGRNSTIIIDEDTDGATFPNVEVKDYQQFIAGLSRLVRDESEVMKEFMNMNKLSTDSFKMPFESTALSNQFRAVIAGIIKKRLVNQKVPGGQLIQVPSTGYFKGSTIAPDNGLKFYRIENNKVRGAEIKIAMQGPYMSLLKLPEVKNRVKQFGETKLQALNELLKDNDFRLKYLGSVSMLAYRIPTQGLSSMEKFEIAEFLPPTAGKIIVVPPEIVAKSGSDFDIDKLSVFFPTLAPNGRLIKSVAEKYDKQKLNDINNQLKKVRDQIQETITENDNLRTLLIQQEQGVDVSLALEQEAQIAENSDIIRNLISTHKNLLRLRDIQIVARSGQKAVLQNRMFELLSTQLLVPENLHSLVTPLSTSHIKTKLQEIGARRFDTTEPTKFRNLMFKTNLDKRVALLTGKNLLGIAAVANTFNQLYLNNNLVLEEGAFPLLKLLNNQEIDSILHEGQLHVATPFTFDGLLKSELYNQFVNATVDAAKEDYLGFANFSKQTMPVVMLHVLLGTPMNRVFEFINNQSIRDYISKSSILYAEAFDYVVMDLINKHMYDYFESTNIPSDWLARVDEDEQLSKLVNELGIGYDGQKFVYNEDPLEVNLEVNLDTLQDSSNIYQQLARLFAYKQMETVGEGMFLVQQLLNFDTAPVTNPIYLYTKPGLEQAILQANVVDTKTVRSIQNNSIISPLDIQPLYLGIMKQLFPKTYNDSLMNEMVKNANMLAQDYNWTNKDYDEYYRRVLNDHLEYMLKLYPARDGDSLSRWALGWIQKNADAFMKVVENDPVLSNMSFFKDLRIGKVGEDRLFMLDRDASDVEYKNVYYDNLIEAYNYMPNRMTMFLFASHLQAPYGRTYYSFSDLIPPSIIGPMVETFFKEGLPLGYDPYAFNMLFTKYNPQFNRGVRFKGYKYRDLGVQKNTKPVEVEIQPGMTIMRSAFNEEDRSTIFNWARQVIEQDGVNAFPNYVYASAGTVAWSPREIPVNGQMTQHANSLHPDIVSYQTHIRPNQVKQARWDYGYYTTKYDGEPLADVPKEVADALATAGITPDQYDTVMINVYPVNKKGRVPLGWHTDITEDYQTIDNFGIASISFGLDADFQYANTPSDWLTGNPEGKFEINTLKLIDNTVLKFKGKSRLITHRVADVKAGISQPVINIPNRTTMGGKHTQYRMNITLRKAIPTANNIAGSYVPNSTIPLQEYFSVLVNNAYSYYGIANAESATDLKLTKENIDNGNLVPLTEDNVQEFYENSTKVMSYTGQVVNWPGKEMKVLIGNFDFGTLEDMYSGEYINNIGTEKLVTILPELNKIMTNLGISIPLKTKSKGQSKEDILVLPDNPIYFMESTKSIPELLNVSYQERIQSGAVTRYTMSKEMLNTWINQAGINTENVEAPYRNLAGRYASITVGNKQLFVKIQDAIVLSPEAQINTWEEEGLTKESTDPYVYTHYAVFFKYVGEKDLQVPSIKPTLEHNKNYDDYNNEC